jgi:predicted DNA-binding protein YlxM (UPF0122 family)
MDSQTIDRIAIGRDQIRTHSVPEVNMLLWSKILYKRMTKAQKRVYDLYFKNDLMQGEIAEKLKITKQAVCGHLNAIKGIARKLLYLK